MSSVKSLIGKFSSKINIPSLPKINLPRPSLPKISMPKINLPRLPRPSMTKIHIPKPSCSIELSNLIDPTLYVLVIITIIFSISSITMFSSVQNFKYKYYEGINNFDNNIVYYEDIFNNIPIDFSNIINNQTDKITLFTNLIIDKTFRSSMSTVQNTINTFDNSIEEMIRGINNVYLDIQRNFNNGIYGINNFINDVTSLCRQFGCVPPVIPTIPQSIIPNVNIPDVDIILKFDPIKIPNVILENFNIRIPFRLNDHLDILDNIYNIPLYFTITFLIISTLLIIVTLMRGKKLIFDRRRKKKKWTFIFSLTFIIGVVFGIFFIGSSITLFTVSSILNNVIRKELTIIDLSISGNITYYNAKIDLGESTIDNFINDFLSIITAKVSELIEKLRKITEDIVNTIVKGLPFVNTRISIPKADIKYDVFLHINFDWVKLDPYIIQFIELAVIIEKITYSIASFLLLTGFIFGGLAIITVISHINKVNKHNKDIDILKNKV